MKKLSIGTWAYIFNQKEPTNDFHEILHKLQNLGYDGVELGGFKLLRKGNPMFDIVVLAPFISWVLEQSRIQVAW